MTEEYLRSVGFSEDWYQQLRRLDSAQIKSIPDNADFDHVVVYDDPSGVAVSLFETADGFSDENIILRGIGGNRVQVFQVREGLAAIDLMDELGELFTRILAGVDDPHMYPVYPLGAVGDLVEYDDYQIGAIAAEVKVFDSVEEWDEHEPPIGDDGIKIGPNFIASPWLFALYGGDASADEANAAAMFKATCEDVEIVTNQLTGRQWYKVLADCSFKCTLALPIDIEPAPHRGSVVDGRVVLTGSTGFWGRTA